MATKKMTHPTLHQHGNNWRHKKHIPADVAEWYPAKSPLAFTTSTGSKAAARVECLQWLAEREAEFDQIRKVREGEDIQNLSRLIEIRLARVKKGGEGAALAEEDREAIRLAAHTQTLASLTDDQREAIKEAVPYVLFAGDDALRSDPMAAEVIRTVAAARENSTAGAAETVIVPFIAEPEEGLGQEQLDYVQTRNEAQHQHLVLLARTSNLKGLIPYAIKAAMAVGLRVDWLAPDGQSLLKELMPLFATASRDVASRDTPERWDQRGFIVTPPAPEAPERKQASKLLLSFVIEGFLRESEGMPLWRKHSAALSKFLDITGDKTVDQLKSADLLHFLQIVQRLPSMRGGKKKPKDLSWQEWAGDTVTMSPTTFQKNYVDVLAAFLRWGVAFYYDQGFPELKGLPAARYRGSREKGEAHQRALTAEELQRLFDGPECAAFAADPAQQGKYWLPLIGLYSGARVNEVCQLNPQCDVYQERKTGIWVFRFSEHTPGDPRVKKSIKTTDLTIPIHSRLIELGILDYVKQCRERGDRLIFPQWSPSSAGKASKNAEKWYREHLAALGLRDETPGGMVAGFHAFRSTFAAKGEEMGELRWGAITGHNRIGESDIQKRYRGKTVVQVQQEILERWTFDIAPPKPVGLCPTDATGQPSGNQQEAYSQKIDAEA